MNSTKKVLIFFSLLTISLGSFVFLPKITNAGDIYELSQGERVILDNSRVIIEPVVYTDGEFNNIKFDVYEGNNKIGSTNDFTRVGWEKKLFYIYDLGHAVKFEAKVYSFEMELGIWKKLRIELVSAPDKPIISEIKLDYANQNDAHISWLVDGEYNCSLVYGLDSNLGNSTNIFRIAERQETQYDYYYSANLENLNPGTRYYYKIVCPYGTTGTSVGEVKTFDTIFGQPDLVVEAIN